MPCACPSQPGPSPTPFFLQTEASEQWDYVLVAGSRAQREPRWARRQQQFLEELEGKGFHYKVGW